MDVLTPELVFGLVGPLGSNIDAAQEALRVELMKVGYEAVVIHLTRDLKAMLHEFSSFEIDTYTQKINLMNDVVRYSGKQDFLARVAIASIVANRVKFNKPRELNAKNARIFQASKKAYIVRQLKRKQEADLLSKVYGKKFVQISIAVSEGDQFQSVLSIVGREAPELSQVKRESEARQLIIRDKDEAGSPFGQSLINVYHSADVFVGGNANEIGSQIGRFIEAFFGSNMISPTRDEFGSFLAKTASFRTLDLSRQVGAAIMSKFGDVITLGCNEVPKSQGGNYWCDDDYPQRDIERGVEPNKLETTRLIYDFVHALSKLDKMNFDPVEVLRDPALDHVLKDAFISDITEFGRITHAEMSALADAARLGRSTLGSTIYVTTFPCHNCAKHLIAAGVTRIVYIEPYAKSKAFELSGDALTVSRGDSDKVLVEHFIGIAPRRYREIFEKGKKRRDELNRVKKWQFDDPTPMIDNKTGTHTFLEFHALSGFKSGLSQVAAMFAARKVDAVKFGPKTAKTRTRAARPVGVRPTRNFRS
ncbi:deaminase [Pseudogemmobacter humi]